MDKEHRTVGLYRLFDGNKVIINGKIVEELPSSFTKDAQQRCIGCGKIDPFSYSGTIIKDKRGGSRVHEALTPIKVSGILESFDRSYPILVGGQPTTEVKRYSYLVKVKGRICTECASDYRTIEFQGKHVPIVQVDSKVVGQTIPVERVLRVESSESASSTPTTPQRPSQSNPKPGSWRHAMLEVRKEKREKGIPDNHWLNVGRRTK